MEVAQVSEKKIRKEKYRQKLKTALNKYSNILIISVDNVGSKQMQNVRINLRGRAEVIMGKNTMIRQILREESEKNAKLGELLPFVKGNIGFVFCEGDLAEIRTDILQNKVPAAAKSGLLAPVDVIIPAGSTGLDPGQTNFFQALNIATKITRGCIEIMNDVTVVKAGDRVSSSAVALLNKLGIKPFFFGIAVDYVYEDGQIYAAAIMDMTSADLIAKFMSGVSKLAAISLAIGYPTKASIPHSFARAFRAICAIAVETEYTFDEVKQYKDLLSDPEALAKMQAAAAAAAGGAATADAAPVEEEAEEEEEEAQFDLFDDDDDDDDDSDDSDSD